MIKLKYIFIFLLFVTKLSAENFLTPEKPLASKVCSLLDVESTLEVGSVQFNEAVLANLKCAGGIGSILEGIAKKSADADMVTEVVFAHPYITFFWNETEADLWRTISLQVGFDRSWKVINVRGALKSRPPPVIDLPLEVKKVGK